MTLAPPPIRVAVNDRQLPVVAVFEHGRVLVPLRAIVEALGGQVSAFHLPLPPPARIIAGRYYAPIRQVANAMHAQIQYDARTRVVQVFTIKAVAAAPRNDTPSVTYTSVPLPTDSPQPWQQPGPSFENQQYYQIPLQLNVYRREITGGDSLQVELIAPPGGQAYASVCTSSYEYPLWASPSSQYYTGTVETRNVSTEISCPITARYVTWNGATIYAPYPVFINLIPFATPQPSTPHPTQTPQPTPTPRRIPLPPVIRATPEPTPHIRVFPIQRETPEPTAAPTAAPTPRPTAKPVVKATEKPTPPRPRHPKPDDAETPSPN